MAAQDLYRAIKPLKVMTAASTMEYNKNDEEGCKPRNWQSVTIDSDSLPATSVRVLQIPNAAGDNLIDEYIQELN